MRLTVTRVVSGLASLTIHFARPRRLRGASAGSLPRAEGTLRSDGVAFLVVGAADQDVGHRRAIHLFFLDVGERAAATDGHLLGGELGDGVRGEFERFMTIEQEVLAEGFFLLGVGLAGQRLTQGAELGERRHLTRVEGAAIEEDFLDRAMEGFALAALADPRRSG